MVRDLARSFAGADTDGNHRLSFDEFLNAVPAEMRTNKSTTQLQQMFANVDADGSGTVERLEFARHMLVSTGKVEARDFDQVLALFDSLDADGSGTIGPEDSNRSGTRGCEQTSDTAGINPRAPTCRVTPSPSDP